MCRYLNRKMSCGEVETFFVPADPTLSVFSSTTVREFIKLRNYTWKEIVPESVADYIVSQCEDFDCEGFEC